MVIKFKCGKCGNTNPNNTYEYDGCLGYEAIVCTCCGTYYDENGEHEPDEWSKDYIEKSIAHETNA